MRRSFLPRLVGGVLLGASGLIACADETATVVEPLDNRSFNFLLNRDATNIPRGSVIATRTGATLATISVAVELRGLEELREPYFYQAWLAAHYTAGDTLGLIQRLPTTRIVRVRTDTTISQVGDFVPNVVTDTLTGTSGAFNFGGPGTLVRLQADAATVAFYFGTGGRPAGTTAVILVTIDSVQGAPTPPNSVGSQGRLWARGLALPAAPAAGEVTTTSTALSFGNFHANANLQYVFVPAGRGQGALLEGENILVLNDSSLARPPIGYFYAAQLITREDDETFYNLDTISLGPQTAPFPDRNVSLFNADIEQVHPVVQTALPNPQIYAAHTRVDGDTIPGLAGVGNPFRGVALIIVTLESKFGTDAISPATILVGTAPAGVRNRD